MLSTMMKCWTHQHNVLVDLNPDIVIQDASPDPIIFYKRESAAQITAKNFETEKLKKKLHTIENKVQKLISLWLRIHRSHIVLQIQLNVATDRSKPMNKKQRSSMLSQFPWTWRKTKNKHSIWLDPYAENDTKCNTTPFVIFRSTKPKFWTTNTPPEYRGLPKQCKVEDGTDRPQKWRRNKANGGSKMMKKESQLLRKWHN